MLALEALNCPPLVLLSSIRWQLPWKHRQIHSLQPFDSKRLLVDVHVRDARGVAVLLSLFNSAHLSSMCVTRPMTTDAAPRNPRLLNNLLLILNYAALCIFERCCCERSPVPFSKQHPIYAVKHSFISTSSFSRTMSSQVRFFGFLLCSARTAQMRAFSASMAAPGLRALPLRLPQ